MTMRGGDILRPALSRGGGGGLRPITSYTYLDYDNPASNFAGASPILIETDVYDRGLYTGGNPHGAGTKLAALEFPQAVTVGATPAAQRHLVLLAKLNIVAEILGDNDSLRALNARASLRATLIRAWNGLTIGTLTYANYGTLTLGSSYVETWFTGLKTSISNVGNPDKAAAWFQSFGMVGITLGAAANLTAGESYVGVLLELDVRDASGFGGFTLPRPTVEDAYCQILGGSDPIQLARVNL